ncbi:polysaccharide deacetylase family protein [Deinococcus alpinitundrae]|uniref:polysaccharide deacetylase family protein n=1 Tax=Deinococcus alpinitundrae TaxID=468913 RepID=UPI001379D088|nr:polysaccharide deacetylase family protein [Deinococcus alpinitundrae]
MSNNLKLPQRRTFRQQSTLFGLISGLLLLSACGSTSSSSAPPGTSAACIQAAGNSAVTFLADDGYQQDWDLLRPIFQDAGLPFVSAIVTNNLNKPGYTTLDEVKQLQAEGDEIVSHTVSHPDLNSLSDAELDVELKSSKAILEADGLTIKHLVYPMGDDSARVVAAASKYYQLGVEVGNGLNDPKALSLFHLHRVALGSYFDVIPSTQPHAPTNTLAYYKERVDEAVRTHQWLIYMVHSSGPGFDAEQLSNLKATVEYAKSQNTKVTTLSGGYEIAQKLAACR